MNVASTNHTIVKGTERYQPSRKDSVLGYPTCVKYGFTHGFVELEIFKGPDGLTAPKAALREVIVFLVISVIFFMSLKREGAKKLMYRGICLKLGHVVLLISASLLILSRDGRHRIFNR
jgi:hypothetical protein